MYVSWQSKLLNFDLKAEDEIPDSHEDVAEVALDVGNHQGQEVADAKQGTHANQSLKISKDDFLDSLENKLCFHVLPLITPFPKALFCVYPLTIYLFWIEK